MTKMANARDLCLKLETAQANMEKIKARSRSASSSPSTPKSSLSLDLSDLPTLVSPSPPSNTLLITNLNDPVIFQPQNLQIIRELINRHVPIYSWSPLKSFRRIIVTFYDVKSAVEVRNILDGEMVFDCRVKVYYGAHLDISPTSEDRHLQAPKLDRQFFISPPPSPPQGWEMRNEGPPNKDVHADDLAQALSRLHARPEAQVDIRMHGDESSVYPSNSDRRKRSGSTTVVFHPEDHGSNPDLPAISVEDTTTDLCESPGDVSPMEGITNAPILHTSRPPIELMN